MIGRNPLLGINGPYDKALPSGMVKTMSLKEFDGKRIVLIDTAGKEYKGIVGDYVYPEDNENGKESVILDVNRGRGPIEFYEEDIRSIELID